MNDTIEQLGVAAFIGAAMIFLLAVLICRILKDCHDEMSLQDFDNWKKGERE